MMSLYNILINRKDDMNINNWGELSTWFSKKRFEYARKHNLNLESTGEVIHSFWCMAQQLAEASLREGKPIVDDYTLEKAESHQAMLVPYNELSREDQIKDLYLAYEFDEKWFKEQKGSSDIIDRFPEVIHWVDWS